jgi:hypothetical protein
LPRPPAPAVPEWLFVVFGVLFVLVAICGTVIGMQLRRVDSAVTVPPEPPPKVEVAPAPDGDR